MESQVRRAGGLQNQRLKALKDENTPLKRWSLSKIGERTNRSNGRATIVVKVLQKLSSAPFLWRTAVDSRRRCGSLFEGLPSPLCAGRYHSLVVELDESSAAHLIVTARSEEREITALAHQRHQTYGVQFHPEWILTQHGQTLLTNFCDS